MRSSVGSAQLEFGVSAKELFGPVNLPQSASSGKVDGHEHSIDTARAYGGVRPTNWLKVRFCALIYKHFF